MTKSILPSLCLNLYQYFHFQTIDLTPPTALQSFNLGNIINLLKYLDLIRTFLHFIDKLETVAGVCGSGPGAGAAADVVRPVAAVGVGAPAEAGAALPPVRRGLGALVVHAAAARGGVVALRPGAREHRPRPWPRPGHGRAPVRPGDLHELEQRCGPAGVGWAAAAWWLAGVELGPGVGRGGERVPARGNCLQCLGLSARVSARPVLAVPGPLALQHCALPLLHHCRIYLQTLRGHGRSSAACGGGAGGGAGRGGSFSAFI